MQKYLPVLRSCPFFTGLTDDEILSILHCVSAAKITRPRGSYIFRAGDSTEVMGLMLSGSTLVIQEDLWGHRNILSKCSTGDFFGEPYAATPGAILNISVVAEEDCEILLLNVKRLLTSCPTACDHHQNTAFQREDHPYQQAHHPGKAAVLPVCRIHPAVFPFL